MPANNDLHVAALTWAEWHHSRRLFAPPPPKNLLARMRAPSGGPELPDAVLDARQQQYNRAVNAEPMTPAKMAFLCYYIHRIKIVHLMDYNDLPRRGLFRRIEYVRERVFLAYQHLETSGFNDPNVVSLAEQRALRAAHATTYQRRFGQARAT